MGLKIDIKTFLIGCFDYVVLQWNGAKGEYFQDVQKFIGGYYRQNVKYQGHFIYANFATNKKSYYLFYKPLFGWRVSEFQ